MYVLKVKGTRIYTSHVIDIFIISFLKIIIKMPCKNHRKTFFYDINKNNMY